MIEVWIIEGLLYFVLHTYLVVYEQKGRGESGPYF